MYIHKQAHTHHTFDGQKMALAIFYGQIYIYIYNIYTYILYIYYKNYILYIYNKQISYINIKNWLGENVYESGNQTLPLS